MGIGEQAVRNTAMNFARYVIVCASSLVVSILLARFLTPANLGIYSYFNWLAAMGCMLATLGLPAACEKYTAECLGSGANDVTAELLRALLRMMGVLAVIVAVAITTLVAVLHLFSGVLAVLLALTVLTFATNIGLAAVLGGSQNYSDLARINGIGAVLQLALLAPAALAGASVAGLLGVNLSVGIATLLLLARKVRPFWAAKPRTEAAAEVLRRVRRFALPASYIALLDFLVWDKSEIIFLKHYRSLEEIAFYSIAVTVVMKIAGAGSTFSGILLPVSSHAYGAAGVERLPAILERSVKYLQMLLAPVAVLGIVISPAVLKFLYGSTYAPAVPAVRILLACLPLLILGSVGTALLYTAEKVSALAVITSAALLVNCGLDFLLIPSRGVIGAALANGITQVAAALAMLMFACRVTTSKLPVSDVLRIYVAALTAGIPAGVVMFRQPSTPFVVVAAAIAYMVTYLGLLLVLRAAGQEEFAILRGAWSGRSAMGDAPAAPQPGKSASA